MREASLFMVESFGTSHTSHTQRSFPHLRLWGRSVMFYLFCSQYCWDTQQRSEARAEPATREKSSSHCWCRRCGYARTSQWAWRSVTGSTWAWSQRHWWRWPHRVPWSFSSCSWLAGNLKGTVLALVSKTHPVGTHFHVSFRYLCSLIY